jgi:hypothetical protein
VFGATSYVVATYGFEEPPPRIGAKPWRGRFTAWGPAASYL